MKTPSWEPSAGALVAWLLANQQARPCDLVTITLQSGTVLRWTSSDVNRTVNGATFVASAGIQCARVTQAIGIEVDSMEVRLQGDASIMVDGTPLMMALNRGAFGGATVYRERAFFDDTGACKGTVPSFYGRVGAVKPGRLEATIEVRSFAELLDVQVPSEVYQAGCRNNVFDSLCGLSAASYTISGATSAASDGTRRIITSTTAAVIAKAAGWAELGLLTITGGANAGIARTVRSHALGGGIATITVQMAFPYAVESGATFTLRAGCNKSKDGDCSVKFANVANFRAEPYVPAPETVT